MERIGFIIMKEIIRAIKWYSLKYFQLTEKRKKFNKAKSLSKHNLSCLKYFFGLKSFQISTIFYLIVINLKLFFLWQWVQIPSGTIECQNPKLKLLWKQELLILRIKSRNQLTFIYEMILLLIKIQLKYLLPFYNSNIFMIV